MNFYSDEIINNIIDNAPLDTMMSDIEQFRESTNFIIQRYALHNISNDYVVNVIRKKSNKVAFYCMDNEFSIFNCPSLLVYNKYYDQTKDEIIYYILITCTKSNFRKLGYASKLLDGFISYIRSKNTMGQVNKIVLSSLENAVLFYECYGFRWTRETLSAHPLLMQHEKFEEKKEYFILELYL